MIEKKCILFGGQGLQNISIGRYIYNYSLETKEIFDIAENITGKNIIHSCISELSIESEMMPICILTIELAILRIIKKLNISYNAVAGHSLGEYVALVAAEVIDEKTALEMIWLRTKLLANNENNFIMVAVIGLNFSKIKKVIRTLKKRKIIVKITNINSLSQNVVCLERKNMDDFRNIIKNYNGKLIALNVTKNFHTTLIKKEAFEFGKYIRKIKFNKPSVDLYLNTTGRKLKKKSYSYKNLVKHMYKPVKWVDIIKNMYNDNINEFIEISAKPILNAFVKDILFNKVKTTDFKILLIENRKDEYEET